MQLYREETGPVVAQYAQRGLVVSVDGTAEVDQVTAGALKGIETVRTRLTAP